MSIQGQGHFFTIYFPSYVGFVLYWDKISGKRLQDHWSSGLLFVIIVLVIVSRFGVLVLRTRFGLDLGSDCM